ncbi:hypothetical protein JKP88DRAFT_333484 [Tribonema minus]|uniref:RWD domain-containing protein 3 n=1 Tax=Tribonema minus TaxID=303371 RepID=A0A835YNK6_9STRA|nr:hypothetical protein JKP88DRAFT_333484 [Tribonema minus]
MQATRLLHLKFLGVKVERGVCALMDDAVDERAIASCAARQQEELDALCAIYSCQRRIEGHQQHVLVQAEVHTGSGSDAVQIGFALPPLYPVFKAPDMTSIYCKRLSKQARELVSSKAAALARSKTCDCTSGEGQECLFDVIMLVLELADKHGTSADDAKAGPSPGVDVASPAAAEQEWVALVRIDHMNDRARYTKALRKWARQLAVAAHCHFRLPVSVSSSGSSSSRVENVALALIASTEAPLRAFVTRLRTEYVDINSRGAPCKERQCSVLGTFQRQRKSGSGGGGSCGGGAGGAAAGTLEVVAHAAEADLMAALGVLGVDKLWAEHTQQFRHGGGVR